MARSASDAGADRRAPIPAREPAVQRRLFAAQPRAAARRSLGASARPAVSELVAAEPSESSPARPTVWCWAPRLAAFAAIAVALLFVAPLLGGAI